jgi:putative transposase
MPARQVFSAIVHVLGTGWQWEALPRQYGSASAVHAHYQRWQQEGFSLKIWRAGMAEYDEMEGIAWNWQSIDGFMGKAPPTQECVVPNSADRGIKWAQKNLLMDAHGVPLSLAVNGANVHDLKLLAATLDGLVWKRPNPRKGKPQRLCADAGRKAIPRAKPPSRAITGRTSSSANRRPPRNATSPAPKLDEGLWKKPIPG